MGPSYFDGGSTPRAVSGIRPLKRAPANAAPPPSREDFIRALRLKLRLVKSFPGLPLVFRRMDLFLARFYCGVFSSFEFKNLETNSTSNFAGCSGIAHFCRRSSTFRVRRPRCNLAWQASQTWHCTRPSATPRSELRSERKRDYCPETPPRSAIPV